MGNPDIPVAGEVVLKPGREKSVLSKHPWIFSGAVAAFPDSDGGLATVKSHQGRFLGTGMFNRDTSIAVRMLTFDQELPAQAVRRNIERAAALRRGFFGAETNAIRLVNAEADGLPGLVVDRYADVLVVQLSTLGMDLLRPFLTALLVEIFQPRGILERSDLAVRREEGLEERTGVLWGDVPRTIDVLEHGTALRVDLERSQKTGLFLDQREMRRLTRDLSAGRRVLNAFCYTGAFTLAALRGGAVRVASVDSSAAALELAGQNAALNGFELRADDLLLEDVFQTLRKPGADFDFIILDPPAFAKKRGDVVPACRGYKDLNRLALKSLPPGGLLLTFSCSHFVDEGLFRQVVFEAALEAGRDVRLLQRHRQAFDHPVSIYHPEGEYLKGFLLHAA